MVTHLYAVTVALIISITVNIAGVLYFSVYLGVERFLNRWRKGSTELVEFHGSHASQLRITYLDVIVGLVLPILAVVVTFTSGVLTDRSKTAEIQIQFAFSVALGVFVFMLAMNVLVKSRNRSVDIVYDVVTISAFSIALWIREEPFIGLIVMTSQGSRSTNRLQRLMKNYWRRETPACREYGVVVFANAVFTVFFNGIIPLLYLLSTMMQTYSMKSQLSSYSIGCFYAYLIFFSFMNGWSLCAVTDESKQYLKKGSRSTSCQVTMRSPGRTLRIIQTGQANEDRNIQFPALPTGRIPPPPYSQVERETKQTVTCCEKSLMETDFVSIPLQTS